MPDKKKRESGYKVQMRLKAEREARERAAMRQVQRQLAGKPADDSDDKPKPPPPPKSDAAEPAGLTPKQKLLALPDEDIIEKAKAVGVYEEGLGRATLIHKLIDAGAIG